MARPTSKQIKTGIAKKRYKIYNVPPKGSKKIKGASNAPLGYSWYSNGCSLFDKNYNQFLVKDYSISRSEYKKRYN